MVISHPSLLADIEAFIRDTGMGEAYFGKRAASNSELIHRLRNGGRVWPETEAKVLNFIRVQRELARQEANGVRDRGCKRAAGPKTEAEAK